MAKPCGKTTATRAGRLGQAWGAGESNWSPAHVRPNRWPMVMPERDFARFWLVSRAAMAEDGHPRRRADGGNQDSGSHVAEPNGSSLVRHRRERRDRQARGLVRSRAEARGVARDARRRENPARARRGAPRGRTTRRAAKRPRRDAVRRSHVRPVTNASRDAPRMAKPPAWRVLPRPGYSKSDVQRITGGRAPWTRIRRGATARGGLSSDPCAFARDRRQRDGELPSAAPSLTDAGLPARGKASQASEARCGDTLSSSSRASPRQGARTRRLRHRVILLGLLTGRGRARRTRRKASAEARSASTASNQGGHASYLGSDSWPTSANLVGTILAFRARGNAG